MLQLFVQNIAETLGIEVVVARFLVNIVLTLILVVLTFAVKKTLRVLLIRQLSKGRHKVRAKTVGNLISSTLSVLIWLIVFLLVLDIFNIDATPILASAGIFGLAIGFGAQSLVKDMVAGFFIVVDNAFNLDETVEINGYRGRVTFMNLRVTHLTNFLGSELIINNGSINQLINWSRNQTTAVVEFGVHYDTDLNSITTAMPKFLEHLKNKFEEIVEMPVFLGVTELADSSINMRVIAKTRTGEHFGIERKIRHELVVYLKEIGVEIPFPQVVVHTAKTTVA